MFALRRQSKIDLKERFLCKAIVSRDYATSTKADANTKGLVSMSYVRQKSGL